jgi:uncharacterized SAM-dependent methyltransferase
MHLHQRNRPVRAFNERSSISGAVKKSSPSIPINHADEVCAPSLAKAGFDFVRMWTDEARLFGVFYFVTASE